jgi:hypothetical protein
MRAIKTGERNPDFLCEAVLRNFVTSVSRPPPQLAASFPREHPLADQSRSSCSFAKHSHSLAMSSTVSRWSSREMVRATC